MKKATPLFFHLLIISFPIFFLTLRGWVNTILLATAVISFYLIYQNKSDVPQKNPTSKTNSVLWIIAALSMPFIAIGLGQFFRTELILRDYDGPFRMLLSTVIFLTLYKTIYPISVSKALFEYSIPTCLYVTLVVSLAHPYNDWGPSRLATYFVDPLTFGSMCLALATMSLASIDLFKRDSIFLRLYKLIAVFAGVYLSLRSGSRTGWFGFPVIVFLIFCMRFYSSWGVKKIIFVFISILVCLLMLYELSPLIHDRVHAVMIELADYQWQQENPDSSSTGVRISLLRMAWFYFLQSPLSGWGDSGFVHLLHAPEITSYTTQNARLFASTAGFHNEIAANMVRSGIWGLIAVLGVFLIPLAIFGRYVKSKQVEQRGFAIIGIGYVLSTLVNGMTTEVFNLKYCASFYAFLIVILLGSILRLNAQPIVLK